MSSWDYRLPPPPVTSWASPASTCTSSERRGPTCARANANSATTGIPVFSPTSCWRILPPIPSVHTVGTEGPSSYLNMKCPQLISAPISLVFSLPSFHYPAYTADHPGHKPRGQGLHCKAKLVISDDRCTLSSHLLKRITCAWWNTSYSYRDPNASQCEVTLSGPLLSLSLSFLF